MRDLSRFVKWPAYVRLQRQKRILFQRLKIPPAVNQFRKPLDRAEALPLFKLLAKYKPETHADKSARIKKAAEAQAAGGAATTTAPPTVLKFGLNHITYLVEQKKAKLVVIASDVDPLELVVWLPALCRRMGVPYAIVNNKVRVQLLCASAWVALRTCLAFVVHRSRCNHLLCIGVCVSVFRLPRCCRRILRMFLNSLCVRKLLCVRRSRAHAAVGVRCITALLMSPLPPLYATLLAPQGRLGTLVHQKKATALALTSVNKDDAAAFDKLIESANAHFANNAEARRKWGGGEMGLKTQRAIEKRAKIVALELAKKALL